MFTIPEFAKVFGADGLLSQHQHRRYEPRAGQVRMAEAIFEALKDRQSLIVEAPCGIGKSYAALVPLILSHFAQWEGQPEGPSVVLTKTIALQEQLIGKDLPTLHAALSDLYPFGYAVLKGRRRYICKRKLGRYLSDNGLDLDDNEQVATEGAKKGRKPKKVPGAVLEWARETLTGDQSECPVEVSQAAWLRISTDTGGCWKGACYHRTKCFANNARAAALQADIVVANYHVALAGSEPLLQNFGYVVCDEAHGLAQISRDLFGWTLAGSMIREVNSLLSDLLGVFLEIPQSDEAKGGSLADLIPVSDTFFSQITVLLEERASSKCTLRPLGPASLPDCTRLVKMLSTIRGLVVRALTLLEAQNPSCSVPLRERLAMKRLHTLVEQALDHLRDATGTASSERWVYWAEKDSSAKAAHAMIRGCPFRVDDMLRNVLFDKHPTILMSATLRSIDGFGFMRRQVGMPESARELAIDSPFDLQKQAAVVIPHYVPMPPKFTQRHTKESAEAEKAYMDRTAVAAAELIRAMGGRTLCLFASWSALDHVWELLSTWAEEGKLPKVALLRQLPGVPIQRTMDTFASDETSVLLGVRTLWEGIDVPGNALKGLYVHKIPFPPPDDPINMAMSAWINRVHGDRASFRMWSLPLAATMFHQGIGRLVRSSTDTGVVVVADQRLTQVWYGRAILGSLPQIPRLPDLGVTQRLLPHLFSNSEHTT